MTLDAKYRHLKGGRIFQKLVHRYKELFAGDQLSLGKTGKHESGFMHKTLIKSTFRSRYLGLFRCCFSVSVTSSSLAHLFQWSWINV